MTPILILLPRPSKKILETLQWALGAAQSEYGEKDSDRLVQEWLDQVEKELQS
jgi:hypothetical protein